MVGAQHAAPLQFRQPGFAEVDVIGQWLLLGGAAFLASTLAAVAGFGGAAVLLPALVAVFGVRDAIPILTVAQLFGNGSRVWFNCIEFDRPVAGRVALV